MASPCFACCLATRPGPLSMRHGMIVVGLQSSARTLVHIFSLGRYIDLHCDAAYSGTACPVKKSLPGMLPNSERLLSPLSLVKQLLGHNIRFKASILRASDSILGRRESIL